MFENYPPGNMLSASLKKLGTAPENLRQKGQRVISERQSTQIHVLSLLQSGHILTEITTRILLKKKVILLKSSRKDGLEYKYG